MSHRAGMDDGKVGEAGHRKEIYTYTAPWSVFAMAWSHRSVTFAPLQHHTLVRN